QPRRRDRLLATSDGLQRRREGRACFPHDVLEGQESAEGTDRTLGNVARPCPTRALSWRRGLERRCGCVARSRGDALILLTRESERHELRKETRPHPFCVTDQSRLRAEEISNRRRDRREQRCRERPENDRIDSRRLVTEEEGAFRHDVQHRAPV